MNKAGKKLSFAVFAATGFLGAAISPARAVTFNILRNLDFGTFAVRNNDAQHHLVVTPNDDAIYDPALLPVTDAHRGEYEMIGVTPNTAVAITMGPSATLSFAGSGQSFTVGSFTTNNPVSDAGGVCVIYLGGTLTTSGADTNYRTGTYTGTVDLTYNY